MSSSRGANAEEAPCVPRFAAPFLIALCFVAAVPFAARANVPSSMNSTVPPCMAACPPGDLAYVVIVRDIGGNAVPNSTVTLDFSACPNVHFCPPSPPPGYTFYSPTLIAVTSDRFGQAVVYLEAGGVCDGNIVVTADGVPLTDGTIHPRVSLANADQTGDGFVGTDDAALIAARPRVIPPPISTATTCTTLPMTRCWPRTWGISAAGSSIRCARERGGS